MSRDDLPFVSHTLLSLTPLPGLGGPPWRDQPTTLPIRFLAPRPETAKLDTYTYIMHPRQRAEYAAFLRPTTWPAVVSTVIV